MFVQPRQKKKKKKKCLPVGCRWLPPLLVVVPPLLVVPCRLCCLPPQVLPAAPRCCLLPPGAACCPPVLPAAPWCCLLLPGAACCPRPSRDRPHLDRLLHHNFSSLSGGPLVEFWWCFEDRDPQMCTWEREKKARNFGPPTLRTLRALVVLVRMAKSGLVECGRRKGGALNGGGPKFRTFFPSHSFLPLPWTSLVCVSSTKYVQMCVRRCPFPHQMRS